MLRRWPNASCPRWRMRRTAEVMRSTCITEFVPGSVSSGCTRSRNTRDGIALEESRGKGLPAQSTALHLRGRRCTPTSLAMQAAPALASRPLARRSRSTGSPASGLAGSVWPPAAELASLTSFAALGQWWRVSLRSAPARAAASPGLAGRAGQGGPAVRKEQAVPRTACVGAHLLGAPQAHRCRSGHAFAGSAVVRHAREEPARQAVPDGRDLRGDEKRSSGVGARSALRGLTRRSCLSAVSEANEASSAPRLRSEHRSEVGAKRRPPGHEPPAGIACCDARALPRFPYSAQAGMCDLRSFGASARAP